MRKKLVKISDTLCARFYRGYHVRSGTCLQPGSLFPRWKDEKLKSYVTSPGLPRRNKKPSYVRGQREQPLRVPSTNTRGTLDRWNRERLRVRALKTRLSERVSRIDQQRVKCSFRETRDHERERPFHSHGDESSNLVRFESFTIYRLFFFSIFTISMFVRTTMQNELSLTSLRHFYTSNPLLRYLTRRFVFFLKLQSIITRRYVFRLNRSIVNYSFVEMLGNNYSFAVDSSSVKLF